MIITGQYFVSVNFLRQVKYMLFMQYMLSSTLPVLNKCIYTLLQFNLSKYEGYSESNFQWAVNKRSIEKNNLL
jgi:hypothetical protein